MVMSDGGVHWLVFNQKAWRYDTPKRIQTRFQQRFMDWYDRHRARLTFHREVREHFGGKTRAQAKSPKPPQTDPNRVSAERSK